MSKRIPLSRGEFATVDDEDFEWLNQFRWYYVRCGGSWEYALRNVVVGGRRRTQGMHRLILGEVEGRCSDHINGDGLDNQRANLRACTHTENMRNRRKHKNNTSGFTGVHWRNSTKKWRAQIDADGRKRHLGYFDDIEEAARAYDAAALKLHGEFATLNFPVGKVDGSGPGKE